jgi:hypothetical protein
MIGRLAVRLGVALAALGGVSSCSFAHRQVVCAGQCAPPYELEVNFQQGTAAAVADKILMSCADHNPVVIRIGVLQREADGLSRAMVYTHVLGNTDRTGGLVKCLRTSGVTQGVGWPS